MGSNISLDRENSGKYMEVHRLASFCCELLMEMLRRQARHFKWGLRSGSVETVSLMRSIRNVAAGPTAENKGSSGQGQHEYRGRQDQNVEHRGRQDRGMGMTARVRVRGGLLRLCLHTSFVLRVEKPHPGVCYKATGGCFTCGSTQHKVKDCPQAKQKQNMPTDFARLPPTTGRVYATTRDQAAKTWVDIRFLLRNSLP
ncbi:zinc finger, CCHC-type, retrotransposon gag domain protein [Tanacetum coccineum]